MNNKKIFFTSDLHIGHANVIKFDKRPFRDLEHMHQVLINNFNSTVPVEGVTYFLGDIGLCNATTVKQVIEQLNGTKVLVLGNHDKGMNAMYNQGFDVVLHGAKMLIANEIVTMSHYPLLGVYREDTSEMKGAQEGDLWHGCNRASIKQIAVKNFGQFHLSGHIHSPNGGKSKKILDKQMDIGVVANNFRPVSISQIESWINIYKRDKCQN